MFRLIAALGVATMLLPAETFKAEDGAKTQTQQVTDIEVSAFDALYAVQSIYTDITSFCDRNAQTCSTGKNIATKAVTNIKQTINTVDKDNKPKVDEQIKTGSVEK